MTVGAVRDRALFSEVNEIRAVIDRAYRQKRMVRTTAAFDDADLQALSIDVRRRG